MSDIKLGNLPQPSFERPEGLDEAGPRPNQAADPSSSIGQPAQSPDYDKAMTGLSDHLRKTPLDKPGDQGGPEPGNLERAVRPASEWLMEQGKLLPSEGRPINVKRDASEGAGSGGSGGGGGSPVGAASGSVGGGGGSASGINTDMTLTDRPLPPFPNYVSLGGKFDANFGNLTSPALTGLETAAKAVASAVASGNPSAIMEAVANMAATAVSSSASSSSTSGLPNIDLNPPPPPTPQQSSPTETPQPYVGPPDAPVADPGPPPTPSDPGDYPSGAAAAGLGGMGGGDGSSGADGVDGGDVPEERLT